MKQLSGAIRDSKSEKREEKKRKILIHVSVPFQ